jgi:hypothetical protein
MIIDLREQVLTQKLKGAKEALKLYKKSQLELQREEQLNKLKRRMRVQ